MRDGMMFQRLDEARLVGRTNAQQQIPKALVDEVYWLALRMLWHPCDAELATRAIFAAELDRSQARPGLALLRVRVLRGAVKYLLAVDKSPFERQAWTFESLADDLLRGRGDALPPSLPPSQQRVLAEELKIGCTQTMLQCLDREQRMIYLLGCVLSLDDATAGYVAGLGRRAFKERLSQARERIEHFMRQQCGLLNPDRPCRCDNRLGKALQTGRVDRRRLLFVLPMLPDPRVEPLSVDASLIFQEQELRGAPAEILNGISGLRDANSLASGLAGKATAGPVIARRQRQRRFAKAPAPALILSLNTRAAKARH